MDAMRKLRADLLRESEHEKKSANGSSVALGRSPSSSLILAKIEVMGHVGTITMNNYSHRNALSVQLCIAIREGIDRCCAAGVRVIIIRADPGVRVWSAGHDVREFKRIDGSSGAQAVGSFAEPLSQDDPFCQLLNVIKGLPIPVIGAVQGSVWGGACDLCACCDMLISTPDVSFAITPAKIGLPYHGSGLTHFLGSLPLHVIKYMFFTSSALTAEQAHSYGFVNMVVASEELTERTNELAQLVASRAPLVIAVLKKQLAHLSSTPSLTADAFEELHEMRKKAWSSMDMEEGVRAFFEKRPPVFEGI